mgnify:CR=1 FL=1
MKEVKLYDVAPDVLDRMAHGGVFFTVQDKSGRCNTMNIGWGSLSCYWNGPVFIAPIRHNRYTYELLQNADSFTVSVPLDDGMKEALALVGTCHGNEVDKYALAHLTPLDALSVNGKVIGVDTDQSAVIDGGYGEGMTVTSAMKGLAPTTIDTLTDVIVNGNWANYAGKIETLGLVSADDPSANYVQLPLETTQWADGKFTVEDYTALVADMFNGKVKVSNDITVEPTVSNIAVNYLGNIKG